MRRCAGTNIEICSAFENSVNSSMDKINLITPPDVLHNQAIDILLIRPDTETREHIQQILSHVDKPFNIYLYDPHTEEEIDIAWMLAVARIADYTVINLDNLVSIERNFSSYIISLPRVYYLTNDNTTPYNKLSTNRIYSLEWLHDTLTKEE